MSIKNKVEELLKFITEQLSKKNLDAKDVFMNGDCGNLFFIFAGEFPGKAIPYRVYYKGEPYHIMTKIEDRFYDINGETCIEQYAEYLRNHNEDEFHAEDFTMEQIPTFEARLQSDLYRYDEDYEQSTIANDMIHLESEIKKRRRELAYEER